MPGLSLVNFPPVGKRGLEVKGHAWFTRADRLDDLADPANHRLRLTSIAQVVHADEHENMRGIAIEHRDIEPVQDAARVFFGGSMPIVSLEIPRLSTRWPREKFFLIEAFGDRIAKKDHGLARAVFVVKLPAALLIMLDRRDKIPHSALARAQGKSWREGMRGKRRREAGSAAYWKNQDKKAGNAKRGSQNPIFARSATWCGEGKNSWEYL